MFPLSLVFIVPIRVRQTWPDEADLGGKLYMPTTYTCLQTVTHTGTKKPEVDNKKAETKIRQKYTSC